jgi:alginate O-acetyltransferase complex protein AlgI
MIFNTLQYALFLPVVVALYIVSPKPFRLWLLLVASYLFYASWNVSFLFLIIGLTVINYLLGLALHRQQGKKGNGWTLAAGIVLNLGVLAFFKYSLFLAQNFVGLFNVFGLKIAEPKFSIILPLAISFFTFEFIHYLIDVYKGKPVVRHPVKFAVFAAFFPTQIAGPIKRYEDFVPQLERLARPTAEQLGAGLQLLLIGLFKKVALADNMAELVDKSFRALSDPVTASPTFVDGWFIAFAFAMQIYFDFSGYTDMGRGSALLLGYSVPENFNRPYQATNISEFWRRWHISLSSWLRDYVYIPLGGNRTGRSRNLLLTMVIGGIWHGANWTFIIWGAFHGGLLVIYWWVRKTFSRIFEQKNFWLKLGMGLAGGALTFGLVCIGWVFFRASNVNEAIKLLAAMFRINPGTVEYLTPVNRRLIAVVVAGCFAVEFFLEHRAYWLDWVRNRSPQWAMRVTVVGWALLPFIYVLLFAFTLVMKPGASAQFIYFQF